MGCGESEYNMGGVRDTLEKIRKIVKERRSSSTKISHLDVPKGVRRESGQKVILGCLKPEKLI